MMQSTVGAVAYSSGLFFGMYSKVLWSVFVVFVLLISCMFAGPGLPGGVRTVMDCEDCWRIVLGSVFMNILIVMLRWLFVIVIWVFFEGLFFLGVMFLGCGVMWYLKVVSRVLDCSVLVSVIFTSSVFVGVWIRMRCLFGFIFSICVLVFLKDIVVVFSVPRFCVVSMILLSFLFWCG